MRRIPNFVLLRAFEAAARLESFTLAAKELNLTQSAISHQVKELEDFFGKKLFTRLNRRVEPTLEGRRLMENLSRVFDVIEASCNEVALGLRHRYLPFIVRLRLPLIGLVLACLILFLSTQILRFA